MRYLNFFVTENILKIENGKKSWYRQKAVTVFLHVLCWVLLFSLPYLMRPSFEEMKRPMLEQNKMGLAILNGINRLFWVGLFYLNARVLISRFLYKRKFWSYASTLVFFFALLFLLDYSLFRLLTTGMSYHINNFFFFNFFAILFVLVSSTAYRMILDRIKADRIQSEKENENLKTELSLLRSQVSPHFMFNVLNNMVALARKGSDQLEPSLIKLSALLRYMLYETDEKVPLQKEIEYLQSYIDLQRQRFGKNVCINACLTRVDGEYEIEPMLLIPFVENAFKHGTGMIEKAAIEIELKAEKGLLHFSVRNKFNEASGEIKDKTSGIGLPNVQRRLKLLYHQKHSLLITKQDNWFVVALQIALH